MKNNWKSNVQNTYQNTCTQYKICDTYKNIIYTIQLNWYLKEVKGSFAQITARKRILRSARVAGGYLRDRARNHYGGDCAREVSPLKSRVASSKQTTTLNPPCIAGLLFPTFPHAPAILARNKPWNFASLVSRSTHSHFDFDALIRDFERHFAKRQSRNSACYFVIRREIDGDAWIPAWLRHSPGESFRSRF